ncbi:MAG: haloacid dehalogenase type II [Myxococcaceae bacterium]
MAFIGFDVYGTLVDPLAMKGPLEAHVGELAAGFATTWRQHQLDSCFRRALMRRYANFDVVTRDALHFTARLLGVPISAGAENELLAAYLQLPAFPDARPGLAALGADGHTLVAFSNGVESSLRKLLSQARLLPPLSAVVSVDDVQTYKPNPAVYQQLVSRGGAPADQTWLVSSNAWDVLGAKSAGLRAAWVRRNLQAPWEGWGIAEPDLVVGSLGELAGRIAGS